MFVCIFFFYHETKDDAKLAIPCGFLLSRRQNESQIRHLGLQFLEDTIRYHWNDLTFNEKLYVKVPLLRNIFIIYYCIN